MITTAICTYFSPRNLTLASSYMPLLHFPTTISIYLKLDSSLFYNQTLPAHYVVFAIGHNLTRKKSRSVQTPLSSEYRGYAATSLCATLHEVRELREYVYHETRTRQGFVSVDESYQLNQTGRRASLLVTQARDCEVSRHVRESILPVFGRWNSIFYYGAWMRYRSKYQISRRKRRKNDSVRNDKKHSVTHQMVHFWAVVVAHIWAFNQPWRDIVIALYTTPFPFLKVIDNPSFG
jgi:hypothetical protein